MSGTVPPPPPMGLPAPQRGIRALNRLPAILAGGAAVGVVGLALWTIMSINDGSSAVSSGDVGQPASGSAADILAHAPVGTEIAAYRPVSRATPTVKAADPAPAAKEAPEVVAADMTEAAIAARKAAWAAYYQAVADRERARIEARRKAMDADTEVETQTAAANPAQPAAPNGGSPGRQDQPRDFFAQAASNPATDYSPFTVTDPISPYELKATDQVTAKLITQLNSDSPGILKAIVTKNVLDHATGNHILIPQGSTLQGFYDTNVSYGQKRVVTAWTRIIYPPPCDQSLDLGAMAGADQTGQAGFQDLTDNHLGQIFTSAILMSMFGAAVQLSQPPQSSFSTYSPMQTIGGSVGQQTSQVGSEFARKGLSIAPRLFNA